MRKMPTKTFFIRLTCTVCFAFLLHSSVPSAIGQSPLASVKVELSVTREGSEYKKALP